MFSWNISWNHTFPITASWVTHSLQSSKGPRNTVVTPCEGHWNVHQSPKISWAHHLSSNPTTVRHLRGDRIHKFGSKDMKLYLFREYTMETATTLVTSAHAVRRYVQITMMCEICLSAYQSGSEHLFPSRTRHLCQHWTVRCLPIVWNCTGCINRGLRERMHHQHRLCSSHNIVTMTCGRRRWRSAIFTTKRK